MFSMNGLNEKGRIITRGEAVKASTQKPCVYENSCNWVSLFMFNG